MASLIWWALDWLKGLLGGLGFSGKEATITFLGLDNAGKTTLLHRIATGEVRAFQPTEAAHVERFAVDGVEFSAMDIGGHEAARFLWSKYSEDKNALVFVVDCADADRFREARDELDEILAAEELSATPLAILFNKTDMATAASAEALDKAFDLNRAVLAERPFRVFRCSAVHGDGYEDALRWIAELV